MCTSRQLYSITQDMVQEYRRVYGSAVEKILLYGSYARNEQDNESDVDIVAIVHGERNDLQELLKQVWDYSTDIGMENDVVISPSVIPYSEYEKYKRILPYYMNIEKEGMKIG